MQNPIKSYNKGPEKHIISQVLYLQNYLIMRDNKFVEVNTLNCFRITIHSHKNYSYFYLLKFGKMFNMKNQKEEAVALMIDINRKAAASPIIGFRVKIR